VVHPNSELHKGIDPRKLINKEVFNGADCSGTRLMMSRLPLPGGGGGGVLFFCFPDTHTRAVASEQNSHARNRILSATDVGAFGAVGD
jgi:hypothetical protein